MKYSEFIIEVVKEKYGEWLEMAGADAPALLTDILACLLSEALDQRDCLRKIINDLKVKK